MYRFFIFSFLLLSFVPISQAESRPMHPDKMMFNLIDASTSDMTIEYKVCHRRSNLDVNDSQVTILQDYACRPQMPIKLMPKVNTTVVVLTPVINGSEDDYHVVVTRATATDTVKPITSTFWNERRGIRSNCFLSMDNLNRQFVFNIKEDRLFCTSFDINI